MAVELAGKEIVENMEYLLELLHEEWEKSGKTRVQITLSGAELVPIHYSLIMAIQDIGVRMEREELNFRQSMTLSKESFVLLRLITKVKETEGKANQIDREEITMELDREEYELFAGLNGRKAV